MMRPRSGCLSPASYGRVFLRFRSFPRNNGRLPEMPKLPKIVGTAAETANHVADIFSFTNCQFLVPLCGGNFGNSFKPESKSPSRCRLCSMRQERKNG